VSGDEVLSSSAQIARLRVQQFAFHGDRISQSVELLDAASQQ
jgi:hypothetical protein